MIMRITHLLLRNFLGVFFIISAYLKLFPIEMLELSIAETGLFSWTQSIFIARLLIGFEMFLGVMLITRAYRKLTWIAAISSLIIFTFYLVYIIVYMPGITDCGCMGLQVHMSPVNSIYKNLILITLCAFTLIIEKRYPVKWIDDIIPARWILIGSLLVTFSLPFVLNPIILDRDSLLTQNPIFTDKVDLNNEPFLTWHGSDTMKISQDKKLVCFFSPSCLFCRLTARKIRVILNESPVPFPVYFLFAGNPDAREKLASFYSETMTESIPTAIIEKEKFFDVSGQNLPVVFYMNGDSIEDRDNFRTLSEDRIMQFFAISK